MLAGEDNGLDFDPQMDVSDLVEDTSSTPVILAVKSGDGRCGVDRVSLKLGRWSSIWWPRLRTYSV
jgi:hypothetical protein